MLSNKHHSNTTRRECYEKDSGPEQKFDRKREMCLILDGYNYNEHVDDTEKGNWLRINTVCYSYSHTMLC